MNHAAAPNTNDVSSEAISSVTLGSRILSIKGEAAELESGYSYTTVPNVVGIIRAVLHDQPKPFILTFPDHHHVTVMLSAADLEDPTRYAILPERRQVQRAIDMHDSFAYIPSSVFR